MGRRGLALLYHCDKAWSDLEGDDAVVRRCPECAIDIVDLDAFTLDERSEYLALAEAATEEVCASFTHDMSASPCHDHSESRSPRRSVVIGRVQQQALPSTRAEMDALVAREKEIASARSAMDAIRERVRRRVAGG
jgi:hypothetical protein